MSTSLDRKIHSFFKKGVYDDYLSIERIFPISTAEQYALRGYGIVTDAGAGACKFGLLGSILVESGALVAEAWGGYSKARLSGGQATGQVGAHYFELIVDAAVANMPSGGVVQLASWINGALNAESGFIQLRDYGSALMGNLFHFGAEITSGTGKLWYGHTLKIRIGSAAKYIPMSDTENILTISKTFTSQAAVENKVSDLTLITDSTFLTGDDITYSSARGSSILKMVGTWTGASGGLEGIDLKIATSGALSASGSGVIGVKVVVTNTAALTAGSIYGGQFIAKHAHATNQMANEAALIGLEAIAYISAAAKAGTAIGLNVVMRNYGAAGQTHRGLQLVLDQSGGGAATEATGICIWNMAGTWTAALRITGAFGVFVDFDDASTCFAAITNAAPSTIGGQILVKMANGNTGYIPVYSTTGT